MQNKKNGWTKFSLRSLLVLVTLAACFFAWVGREWEQARLERGLAKIYLDAGALVTTGNYGDASPFASVISANSLNGRVTLKMINPPTATGASSVNRLWASGLSWLIYGNRVLGVEFPSRHPGEKDYSLVLAHKQWRTKYGTDNSSNPLDCLQQLSSLIALDCAVDNLADLGPLARHKNLRLLRFESIDLNPKRAAEDVDLQPISLLPELHLLQLTLQGQMDLGPLTSLKKVQSVHLVINGQRDLSQLPRIQNLHSLYLACATDEALADVGKVTSLKRLVLGNQGFSNLAPLSGLKNLDSLLLHDTEVSDLSPLKDLNITHIQLSGNPIKSLEPLQGMKSLKLVSGFEGPAGEAEALELANPGCAVSY